MPQTTQNGEPESQNNTGSEKGSNGLPNSKPSSEQEPALKKRWQKPKNIMDLASQINSVANLVLNDQIDHEKARVYSALIRGVAQACSIEANRHRFSGERPMITFSEEEE